MPIRCKFQLTEIHTFSNGESKKFIFEPRYDTSIPEDQRFYKSSPSGRFEVTVNNPVVFEHWKIGNYYYFDATPVPAPQS
ncbi:MAG: hypothetical protein KGL39_32775 [Patescibacteria group bacterium]|nr:hypothetical protein [Patescibacteria group bacterium]